ncbi:MAG: hypothetical protein ACJ76H_12745 [Bacteriovoracaceae bacterium]
MKALLVAILLFSSALAFAQGTVGVGAMVGNPTGLNMKFWLPRKNAVDAGAAFSLGKHSNFSLHSDYLFQNAGALIFNDKYNLDVYYGIGGRMKFSDDIELGVRLPVGLAHMVENERADVFGEIAPIVDFIGRTGLEISLAIGGRYYF